jgi:probable HAF family extracellular repeat protein
MKTRTLTCITAITLFATLAAPVRLGAQEQQNKKPSHYTLTILDTLGGSSSGAMGINNRGQVAGGAALPGDTAGHAVLWSKGVITDLGSLQGGPYSVTYTNPNERGEVSGMSNTSTPDPNGEDFCFFTTYLGCLGFLWQDGVLTALRTLGGNNSLAYQLNDRAQIVGVAENTTQDPTCTAYNLEAKPVIWHNGAVQELPAVSGDPDGFGYGINDRGQIVGSTGACNAMVPFSSFHAVLWPNGPTGGVIDLGNLGGTTLNVAFYINNQGQVVGQSGLSDGITFHAFLWTKDAGMRDLGTLPGDIWSWANNINNKGQAVGTSFPATGGRAFIWQNGVMTDLNTLIPAGSPLYLLEAFGINDRGQISGFGQLSNGDHLAYLLNPCGKGDEGCGQGESENAALSTSTAPRDAPNNMLLPSLVRRMSPYRFPSLVIAPRN